MINTWFTIFFVFVGTLFIFIASIGMLRMSNLLIRIHAATKASTLGVGLILIGAAIHFYTWAISVEIILIIWFILMTAPIASHLIARASYFSNIKLTDATFIDELKLHRGQHIMHRLESTLKSEINKGGLEL